ncbi:MAG: hypothetical protein WAX69_11650 [Victivallales bacterium]
MNASVIDLRYRMRDVLKALDNNEKVQVLCHGKAKGVIMPAGGSAKMNVRDHEFFGMNADEKDTVDSVMDKLRGGRHT